MMMPLSGFPNNTLKLTYSEVCLNALILVHVVNFIRFKNGVYILVEVSI